MSFPVRRFAPAITRPFHAHGRKRSCMKSLFYRPQIRGHATPSPAVIRESQFRNDEQPATSGTPLNAPETASPRVEDLKSAKPFSAFLTDNFNRQHDYLRISITEKCNLRCLYCMPEEGVPLSPKKHLLTPKEILYLSSIFVSQGVSKIRLTGGEPTVHPHILPMLKDIGSLRQHGLRELALTTNGLTLHRKLDAMVDAGVTGINLSLDTLDPFQFEIMTRRKGFEQVMKSIDKILEMKRLGAPLKLKINAVVIRGLNDAQIMPFVEMTRHKDLEVRFIEYMPFDGNKWSSQKMLGYQEMLAIIQEQHPDLHKVQDHPNDTSKTFQVPGFQGRLGFITSMTEHFCGSCNRLRITSDGNLKVCLFGNAEVSLRDMLRASYNNGEPIDDSAWEAMKQLEMDRKEGRLEGGELGFDEKEMQLLDVIGMAVKRKKARHAGIGVLEHMKNRPMILIDSFRPSKDTSSFNLPLPFGIPSGIGQRQKHSKHVLFGPHMVQPPASPMQHARYFSSSYSTTQASAKNMSQQPTKEAHDLQEKPSLTHLNSSGEAHMVNLPPPVPPSFSSSENSSPVTTERTEDGKSAFKSATMRVASAVTVVEFSNDEPYRLISATLQQASPSMQAKAKLPKGDVIATSRIAGIMAAKRTADLIPLCHNIPLSGVNVDIEIIAPSENMSQSSLTSTPSSPTPPAASNGNIEKPYGAVKIEATVKTYGQTGVEMEALTAASVASLTVYDMCKAVDRGMKINNLRVTFKSGGRSGEWRDGIKVS